MAENSEIITMTSQQTIMLQGVGSKLGNDVIPYLERIESGIFAILGRYTGKNVTANRQAIIQRDINELTREELQAYTAYLKGANQDVGEATIKMSVETIEVGTTDEAELNEPSKRAVNAVAVSTPIQVGEKSWTTYNKMLQNYWQRYTEDINTAVLVGFQNGGTIQEISQIIYNQIHFQNRKSSKSVLDMSKRSAKSIAITGTNHYANSARIAFGEANEDVIKGYRSIAVVDSRTSQQCRSLDGVVMKSDNPKFSKFKPPRHPNCRSALAYEVAEEYQLPPEERAEPALLAWTVKEIRNVYRAIKLTTML